MMLHNSRLGWRVWISAGFTQNENITSEREYVTLTVYVGRHVTPSTAQNEALVAAANIVQTAVGSQSISFRDGLWCVEATYRGTYYNLGDRSLYFRGAEDDEIKGRVSFRREFAETQEQVEGLGHQHIIQILGVISTHMAPF
jgi:hypothetical protein